MFVSNLTLDRAAELIDLVQPIRYRDPASGIELFFHLNGYRSLIDEEEEGMGDPYSFDEYKPAPPYEVINYSIHDPGGNDIGTLIIDTNVPVDGINVTLHRQRPYTREHDYHWSQVNLFFEQLKQVLRRGEAPPPSPPPAVLPAPAAAPAPIITPTPAPASAPTGHALMLGLPTLPSPLGEQSVRFYGSPMDVGVVTALFAHRLAPHYAGELFRLNSPPAPDAPLMSIAVYDTAAIDTLVGVLVAQRLPHNQSLLVMFANDSTLPAFQASWGLLRAELEQQGWIDPSVPVVEPSAAPVEVPALHEALAPTNTPDQDTSPSEAASAPPASPRSAPARETAHFAYDRARRQEIVRSYREARDRGDVSNKDAWAQANHSITGKTLLAYEKEVEALAEG